MAGISLKSLRDVLKVYAEKVSFTAIKGPVTACQGSVKVSVVG